MPFRPGSSEPVAHALHLLALAGAPGTAPSYSRLDRRARGAARHAPPPASLAPPDAGIRDALARDQPPVADAPWFGFRWAHGEADAMHEQAARQATEAAELPHGGLLPSEEVELFASTALGPVPFATSAPWRVVLAHGAPGAVAPLAVIAERLRPHLPLAPLDEPDAHRVRLHVAVTAVARATGGVETLRPWLWALAQVLLPTRPEERDPCGRWVRTVAEQSLDQPPGEVERIADGLARSLTSRLERAWRRGFFVPPGFDLDGWMAAARG